MNSTKRATIQTKIRTLLTAVLIAGTLSCQGGPETEHLGDESLRKIIDGEETNYEEWRGVVGLYIPGDYMDHICTGTLIDPQVVLTAGHCVYIYGFIHDKNAVSGGGGPTILIAFLWAYFALAILHVVLHACQFVLGLFAFFNRYQTQQISVLQNQLATALQAGGMEAEEAERMANMITVKNADDVGPATLL